MPKRKNDQVSAEDEDDETNAHEKTTQQQQQQQPQKVYDFHKKTIEVYPQRLLELNRQFVASISSQVEAEEYSVLVGNCLDYVRQYFNYEDDLLQYSPWLATRLKQSRSDIVKCLQETIDIYEALARHEFDRIIDKNSNGTSSDDTFPNKTITSTQSSTPSFQFRPTPPTTNTTTSSSSVLNFPKSTTTTTTAASATTTTTTTTASDTTNFSFGKSTTTTTTANNSSIPATGFSFSKGTTAVESSPSTTGFSLSKSSTTTTTTASDSLPSTGFNFSKPITTTSDSTPSTGFSFKLPSASASPDKQTNASPFAFSIPSTGFGTSTFTSPSFGNTESGEKTSTSLASSINFSSLPKFSFGSTPVANTEQQATGDDNEDEPSEPPEPEKVEHETDAKLTYRCRMGVVKSDKLVKRGPVQVVLKESNGKHQLIIRSDDALGRLYLNILWAKPLEAKKKSTKNLAFACHLYPTMSEFKEGDVVTILLQFDNETDRNDAHDKLNKELL